jgi:antitoxin FitA
MATLTIRDFPDKLRERLRARAAGNKRSMEAEVRHILTQALAPERLTVGKTVKLLESVARRGTLGGVSGFEEPAKKWKGRGKRTAKDALDLLSAQERKVMSPQAQRALQQLREMFGVRDKDPNKSMVDEFLAERKAMWGEED